MGGVEGCRGAEYCTAGIVYCRRAVQSRQHSASTRRYGAKAALTMSSISACCRKEFRAVEENAILAAMRGALAQGQPTGAATTS